MSNGFLLERDVPNGKQGKAFLEINGQNNELFSVKKLRTEVEYQKTDFRVTGTNTIQSKTTGAKKTGSMTIYMGTPLFVQMASEYEENGKVLYFNMQITNEDPATSIGRQSIGYYGCSLDRIPLSLLDADADYLEEEVTFTYTSFKVLENFTEPAQLG